MQLESNGSASLIVRDTRNVLLCITIVEYETVLDQPQQWVFRNLAAPGNARWGAHDDVVRLSV